MNKKHILFIGLFLVLVTLIGVSYAFFSAIIKGNDIAGENVFTAGTMELTFTDNDNAISLPNAKPGDTDSKTFTVQNTGTLDDVYTYNIKLSELETNFEQEDLTYKLVEYTDDNYNVEKPDGIKKEGFINKDLVNEDKEMYLAINITRPEKTLKHYYKLTITFENLDVPQDYNQGAEFSGKINVDDNPNAKVYIPSKSFTDVVAVDNTNIFADEAENIRYAGATPNNYIWFNCDDYSKVTNETTAAEQNCEKWRIIGVMKDIEKEDSNTEDLVKIVRADDIGEIAWDSGKVNDWTNASLQKGLNGPYLVQSDTGTWITNDEYTGSYEDNTISDNYKSITSTTLGMIESVKWHLGGIGSTYQTIGTPKVFYEAERGEETYNNQPSIWLGKVGLIYPSDYGYATSGGGDTGREGCLAKEMYRWDTAPWKTDCAGNSWLKPSSSSLWTLMPYSRTSSPAFYVRSNLSGGNVYDNGVRYTYFVWPSLYLKSNVKIAGEGGNGSAEQPYILVQEIN